MHPEGVNMRKPKAWEKKVWLNVDWRGLEALGVYMLSNGAAMLGKRIRAANTKRGVV